MTEHEAEQAVLRLCRSRDRSEQRRRLGDTPCLREPTAGPYAGKKIVVDVASSRTPVIAGDTWIEVWEQVSR
jgi:hypothetical protein